MLRASSPTLVILRSLYPRADLEAAGEGFAATCSDEEAKELVKSFLDTVTKIIEMIPSRCNKTCSLSYVHDIVYKQLSVMSFVLQLLQCKFPCYSC
jgi:hypothetical protein